MKQFGKLLLLLLFPYLSFAQKYSIILGRPTDKTMTLSVLFDQNAEYFVEYGTQSGVYSTKTSVYADNASVPREFDLEGLTKNTRYYYRMQYRLKGATNYTSTPEYNFMTPRDPGNGFTFTVEADEHLYDKKGVDNLYRICLENQLKDKPDFMLSLGDTFGDDHNPTTITSLELKTLHANYRPFLGNIAHSVPFYFCMGNHEGENNFYIKQAPPNNLTVQATLWRKYYYPNPSPNSFYSGNQEIEDYGVGNPENYYAWTWGDALFVVLDAYRYQSVDGTSEKPKSWDWTLGKKQYDWMRNTIEGSKAKYKFVFAHHIRGQDRGALTNAKLYEWGGYDGDGKTYSFDKNRPGWGKPIHQVFKDSGVTIFFQGHDHLFAKEDLDGMVYQEVPMPSDSTYEIGMLANADAYTANQKGGAGHIRVQVNPDNVKVDFVRAYLPSDTKTGGRQNQEIGFSYTIGTVKEPVVLETWTEDKELQIHPNPANEQLFIQIPPGLGKANFQLYSMAGQLVLTSNQPDISVKKIPDGPYLIVVETENKILKQKIVIKH